MSSGTRRRTSSARPASAALAASWSTARPPTTASSTTCACPCRLPLRACSALGPPGSVAHVRGGPLTGVGSGTTVGEGDYATLDTVAKKIADEKQPFERLEMTKEELLQMFHVRTLSHRRRAHAIRGGVWPNARWWHTRPLLDGQYNPLKVHFITEKVADGGSSTVYRCGPLIDLCLGPHVPNTNRIKAFQVYKVSRRPRPIAPSHGGAPPSHSYAPLALCARLWAVCSTRCRTGSARPRTSSCCVSTASPSRRTSSSRTGCSSARRLPSATIASLAGYGGGVDNGSVPGGTR